MNDDARERTLREIGERRISAILRTDDTAAAREAMEAAVKGGFRLIEFTLTIPGALELIAEFSRREGILVGAGTVLSTDGARDAVKAGARFLVSPITDPLIIAEARELGAVSVPGASTPTEMMAAHRAGADVVKIFPAPSDLPAFITQIRGPLPFLKLFPTAGVTPENFVDVLRAGAFGAGFVAPLFTPRDLKERNAAAIETRARTVLERFRLIAPGG